MTKDTLPLERFTVVEVNDVAAFVCGEPRHRSAQQRHNRGTAMPLLRHSLVRIGNLLRLCRGGEGKANR